ncbi:MAG: hypothetical protein GKC03_08315 [Methanomassiliicoccales archaeon]|nr:hypothetical protein [Methanomassiliicoccales archaeon]NYT15636.1 hypothetical protein [Methanomassiliicoccales archaeon]
MRFPNCGSEIGERRNYWPFCGTRQSIPTSPGIYAPRRSQPVRLSKIAITVVAILAVLIGMGLILAIGGDLLRTEVPQNGSDEYAGPPPVHFPRRA